MPRAPEFKYPPLPTLQPIKLTCKFVVKEIKTLIAESAESSNIDSNKLRKGLLKRLNTPKAGLSPTKLFYGCPTESIILAQLNNFQKNVGKT